MRDADLERLYVTEAQAVFRFLAYRTGDRALAQDLLADTFERVLRARARYDRGRGSQRTWLYAIARNVLADHVRRAAAEARAHERAQAAAAGPADEDAFDTVADRDEVARALARLSVPEREAIALRFGADLTMPELATVLKEPLTTVEGRVYRALRKLRADLG